MTVKCSEIFAGILLYKQKRLITLQIFSMSLLVQTKRS